MTFRYRMLVFLAVLFLAGPFVLAQSWLRTETEELTGDYGEMAKQLQQTTDEGKLIAVLKQPGTENEILFLKMLACKRLATHGTAASVPVLAENLADPKMSHFARYALEPIPGKEVDEALCEATTKLQGQQLIGVINSLGVRKNPDADEYLLALVMEDGAPGLKDAEILKAVASSFAMIASEGAVDFFSYTIPSIDWRQAPQGIGMNVADAAFICAEAVRAEGDATSAARIYRTVPKIPGAADFQKESAVYQEMLTLGDSERGLELLGKQLGSENQKLFEAALKAAREMPVGEAVTKKLLEALPNTADVNRKALLVLAIGDRTDPASRSISLGPIAEIAAIGDPILELAAIRSLKKIGNPSVLPQLVKAAASSHADVASAASATLAELPGSEVDAAIVAMLEKGDAKSHPIAIDLIKERRIVKAFPVLQKFAESKDEAIRKAALSALSEVVTLADLHILIDVLADAKTPEEIEANQWTLKAACSRMPKEEVAQKVVEYIEKAKDSVKMNLLEILMQIGGETAVKAVSDYAWSKSDALQDKATELLGKWRDPDDANAVAAICLKLAKEGPEKYKVRGLRGYVRYPRQFPMDEPQRINMVQEYLKIAKKPADRILVMQAFTKYPSARMLEEAMKLIDDEQLVSEAACSAAVQVGDKLQGSSQATADAMKKVLEKSKNNETKTRAKLVLDRQ
ncbi:MAG: HEAT repeat domain-containing protein [Thermoguttaceae bacterium]